MGSVLAASSPNPSPPASGDVAVLGLKVPPGFEMPPFSSDKSPSEVATGQQQEPENPLPNPGAFDECHRKCKGKMKRSIWPSKSSSSQNEDRNSIYCLSCLRVSFSAEVFPMQMEGVRLVVNKGLSNYFQVSCAPSWLRLNCFFLVMLLYFCISVPQWLRWVKTNKQKNDN